jgi:hypothetical protein
LDATDRCPDTRPGAAVDAAGCSRAQFCTAIEGERSPLLCLRADWQADEPGAVLPRDCTMEHVRGFRWRCQAP